MELHSRYFSAVQPLTSKVGQLVTVAVQIGQCREVLHAREVLDVHVIDIDARQRRNFISVQHIVIRCVEVVIYIVTENLIGEVILVDGNARRMADGYFNGMIAVLAVNVIGIRCRALSGQEEVVSGNGASVRASLYNPIRKNAIVRKADEGGALR